MALSLSDGGRSFFECFGGRLIVNFYSLPPPAEQVVRAPKGRACARRARRPHAARLTAPATRPHAPPRRRGRSAMACCAPVARQLVSKAKVSAPAPALPCRGPRRGGGPSPRGVHPHPHNPWTPQIHEAHARCTVLAVGHPPTTGLAPAPHRAGGNARASAASGGSHARERAWNARRLRAWAGSALSERHGAPPASRHCPALIATPHAASYYPRARSACHRRRR